MKLKNYINKHSILIKFFIPYIFFLLVIILISLGMYFQTIKVVREEVVDKNIAVLEQTKDILDEKLLETELVALKILESPKVGSLKYQNNLLTGTNVNRTIELQKELKQMTTNNRFILDYFILYEQSNIAISPNRIYKISDLYKNEVIKYDHLSYDNWYDIYMRDYHFKKYIANSNVILNNKQEEAITYINSLGYQNSLFGSVAIFIDNNEIRKLLNKVDVSSGGSVYITDGSGQILTSISSTDQIPDIDVGKRIKGSSEIKVNGEKMMVSYTTSKIRGWNFIAVQPSSLVFEKVTYIKKISYTILSFMVILGMIVAYFFAYRHSKPVKSLKSYLNDSFDQEANEPADIYRFIKHTMTDLKENNKELEDKIEEQKPFLRASFFERLIHGELEAKQNIDPIIQHLGISLEGNYYAASIFHLDEYENKIDVKMLDDLSIKKAYVKNVLDKCIEDKGHFHDFEEDKIILILTSKVEDKHQCHQEFQQLLSLVESGLYKQYNLRPFIALGSITDRLVGISTSYQDALLTLNYQKWKLNSNVSSYYQLPKTDSIYYFPIDLEQKLITFIKAGERSEAKDLLDELFIENAQHRHLSLLMLSSFVNEVHGTFVKVSYMITNDEKASLEKIVVPRELHSFEEIKTCYYELTEQFLNLCAIVNQQKKVRNNELKDSMVAYIQENFQDSDFSLVRVADHFKLSDIYISNFLKEQCGITFSEYLSDLRMNKARELLANTDLNITNITLEVGYNSSNSFCRAFKRIHGISPTTYRSSAKT